MSELIDRQQAIDALRGATFDFEACEIVLKQLSPAQLGTDCISRQALLDKFEPWLKVKDYNDGELNMLKAILYEIRFMRSAEPKRGWWIEIINSRGVVVALRCSRCEKSPRHGVRSDFCPNCGADMRGEKDG